MILARFFAFWHEHFLWEFFRRPGYSGSGAKAAWLVNLLFGFPILANVLFLRKTFRILLFDDYVCVNIFIKNLLGGL